MASPFAVLGTACDAINHLLKATSNLTESIEEISEIILDGTKAIHELSNEALAEQIKLAKASRANLAIA